MAAKDQQRKREWNRKGIGAAVAGVGAAVGLGWLLSRVFRSGGDPAHGAAATSEDPVAGHVGHSGAARSAAGPETMRDPPETWSKIDEAVDESFPASDPAPVGGSKVD